MGFFSLYKICKGQDRFQCRLFTPTVHLQRSDWVGLICWWFIVEVVLIILLVILFLGGTLASSATLHLRQWNLHDMQIHHKHPPEADSSEINFSREVMLHWSCYCESLERETSCQTFLHFLIFIQALCPSLTNIQFGFPLRWRKERKGKDGKDVEEDWT